MSKIAFAPFSILSGFLAGFVATKAFEFLWGLVDDQEAPEPDQRAVRWPKLVAAMALEGAIFRAVRGIVDHGARRTFKRLTGAWPGEEAPDPA
jgi:Protein of unknown function (DUF4235)